LVLKQLGEELPIGLIPCADKSEQQIELLQTGAGPSDFPVRGKRGHDGSRK
jgi:hypothetical protein